MEVGGALTWSPVVDIITVKMNHLPTVLQDGGNRTRRLVGHGLHIKMQAAGRMIDRNDETACFSAGGKKTGLHWRKRFDRQGHALFSRLN